MTTPAAPEIPPTPCAHGDWTLTAPSASRNPPTVQAVCRICGATQPVDEAWLAAHPAVVQAAVRTLHMVRHVEETL